jgi:predicted MFS family arabinose efflux permease
VFLRFSALPCVGLFDSSQCRIVKISDRMGKGLRTAPRDAMIADASAVGMTGRDFGITRFLDTLGAMTSLSIVYFMGFADLPFSIQKFQKLVLLTLPFGLISVLLLVFWIPRIPRKVKSKKYLSLLIPKKARVYLSILFVFSLGSSSDAFLVLKAQEIGMSFSQILLVLVGFNFLAAVLSFPVGKLSDKFGRFRFLVLGWAVYVISYFAFAQVHSISLFCFIFVSYGAFYGFTEGVEKALLSDLLSPEERGAGFGSLQLVLGLAALPASLITGYLMTHYGSQLALMVSGLFALLGFVGLLCWKGKQIISHA